MESNEVIIVGGGLAGLTAAIHLSKLGITVTVFEKNEYPKHKVCGEYISNEIVPYLNWLEVDYQKLKATKITQLIFSTAKGRKMDCVLPLGGFGVSRHALDNLMFQKAISNGCKVILESVDAITFDNNVFTVTTLGGTIYKSKIVLGAFGKRSSIDQKMHRPFINKKSPWLAVKGHYKGTFPEDVVGLYNFKGGYCGVSKVENDVVNICYLADYESFKNYKNTEDYQTKVLSKNPELKSILDVMTPLFEKPITISQISFDKKDAVENHLLMIGDTAGLIHPLCGNGMAMAIHSAKIASELAVAYCGNRISRQQLEKQYTRQWKYHFRKRIRTGRILASLLQKPKLSETLFGIVYTFPFLLPLLINKTHGKPITIKS